MAHEGVLNYGLPRIYFKYLQSFWEKAHVFRCLVPVFQIARTFELLDITVFYWFRCFVRQFHVPVWCFILMDLYYTCNSHYIYCPSLLKRLFLFHVFFFFGLLFQNIQGSSSCPYFVPGGIRSTEYSQDGRRPRNPPYCSRRRGNWHCNVLRNWKNAEQPDQDQQFYAGGPG